MLLPLEKLYYFNLHESTRKDKNRLYIRKRWQLRVAVKRRWISEKPRLTKHSPQHFWKLLDPNQNLTNPLNSHSAAAAAKSLQSSPTLCDPVECGSPPGSPIPGILQARKLEWVAISSSNAWKWKVKVKLLSRVQLLATPWTSAHQAPLSMGFSRQEYWSGVPLPSPKSPSNS